MPVSAPLIEMQRTALWFYREREMTIRLKAGDVEKKKKLMTLMRQLEFWIFMRYLIILLSIFRCDTDIAIICKKEVFIHF